MYSVDKLRNIILTKLAAQQKDPRFRDLVRNDGELQRAMGENRALQMWIQDADDENYWAHINLIFGNNGEIVSVPELEDPTVLMWFHENTFHDIYEGQITFTQAFFWARIQWEGAEWTRHAFLLKRFFERMLEFGGIVQ